MAEPSAEQPSTCEKSVSGQIEGPGGYNGARPSNVSAPVKHYPGSGSIGKNADKSGKGGGMIEGPASKK